MVDEKYYEMEDGSKYILIENVIIDGRRYLLLNNDFDDKVFIAFEDNGDLVFLNENDANFNKILLALFGKIKKYIQVEN